MRLRNLYKREPHSIGSVSRYAERNTLVISMNNEAMKVDGGEESHCSTCKCGGCSASQVSRFVPSTPPAPPLHERVAEGEREDEDVVVKAGEGDDEVETCEVNFVPVEDDFGVFSGVEDDDVSEYSEVEPVPVVDEMVEVEDEGDVVAGVEKLGDRWMMDRVAGNLERDGEGNDDGQEGRFLWNQRITVARLWRTQVDAYEGRIRDLEKWLGFLVTTTD